MSYLQPEPKFKIGTLVHRLKYNDIGIIVDIIKYTYFIMPDEFSYRIRWFSAPEGVSSMWSEQALLSEYNKWDIYEPKV